MAHTNPVVVSKRDLTCPPCNPRRACDARASASLPVLVPELATDHSVEDRLVDDVVRGINELQRRATFNLAYEMGKLIVERLYGGDIARWRQNRSRDASFRRLADRSKTDLHVSASTLFRSAALFETVERLGVSSPKHLSATHICAVFGLPEEHQRRLLGQAEACRWSTKVLKTEAAAVRAQEKGRRGRKPLPAFVRTAHALEALLSERRRPFEGLEEFRSLASDERRRVADVLTRASSTLRSIAERVTVACR